MGSTAVASAWLFLLTVAAFFISESRKGRVVLVVISMLFGWLTIFHLRGVM